MEIISEIRERIRTTMNELNNNNNIPLPVSYSFRCSDLIATDIKEIDGFNKFIKGIDNSCRTIYWFEITSATDTKSIVDEISICRKTNRYKVPPCNKNTSDNILYVGKVRKNFKYRAFQHFGYGCSNTWSLQLRRWALGLDLNLTLNYIQFEDISNIKLAIFEQCIATKLNPILGNHSL